MEKYRCSVTELAERLGLSESAMEDKLSGRCEFTLDEIEKMAVRFACSLDYLVGHQVLGDPGS